MSDVREGEECLVCRRVESDHGPFCTIEDRAQAAAKVLFAGLLRLGEAVSDE